MLADHRPSGNYTIIGPFFERASNLPRQFHMVPSKLCLNRGFQYLIVSAFSMCMAVHGQTIDGTWQGTLTANQTQRIVLKFAKADNNGQLNGSLILIDRGPSELPLLSVTFAHSELKATIANISYRGKLAADNKSIAGVWTQDNQSYPLTLVLATPETLWTYSGPALVPPMAAIADPAFEVATIKPSRKDEKGGSWGFKALRFEAVNASVSDLIKFAYKVRNRQIDGGPSWMNEDKFDIAAETDTPGKPSDDQQRSMVRKLLTDRFGLKMQMIQREFPVYALTVAKSPPKVTASNSPGDMSHRGIYVHDGTDGQTALQFANYTIPDLTDILMNFIQDRQIVDETGLTGSFNFVLTIPTNTLYGKQGSDEADRATAYFAAMESLGFKFIRKNSPLKVIVIENLDQPSAN